VSAAPRLTAPRRYVVSGYSLWRKKRVSFLAETLEEASSILAEYRRRGHVKIRLRTHNPPVRIPVEGFGRAHQPA
jgi:hypothetical protein